MAKAKAPKGIDEMVRRATARSLAQRAALIRARDFIHSEMDDFSSQRNKESAAVIAEIDAALGGSSVNVERGAS